MPLARAWELGWGGLVALLATGSAPFSAALSSVCGWVGLAALAASIAFTPGGESLPGVWAFLPVIATVLVIAGQYGESGGRTPIVRSLSWPPLVVVGKLSYSLYLWHWPVFSFIDYLLVLYSPGMRAVLKIALTSRLAVASYAWIESPMRGRLARPASCRLAYAAFAFGVIFLSVIGFGIRRHFNLNGTMASVRCGGQLCGSAGTAPATVLAGDSTACMFATTIRDICRESGTPFVVAAVPSKNPLQEATPREETLRSLTQSIIVRERPGCVIFSAFWSTVLTRPGDTQRLRECVESMLAFSDRVILSGQPPLLPPEATREGMRHGGRPLSARDHMKGPSG